MTVGVKYISYANSSGYGLAALGYIRALHNAGVPVWWEPSFLGGPVDVRWRPEHGLAALPLARAAAGDAALADLPALAQNLCRPIDYDTVILHTVPEHWPRIAQPGRQNIGYTTWETDALPGHWPPLLAVPDKVFVPSTMNGELFRRDGAAKSVHVVPHVRRHAWNTPAPDEKVALRRRLGIPGDHFVFHTIGVWDPRKAVGDLVALYARQFSIRDKVSLLIKTSAAPSSFAAGNEPGAPIPALVRVEVDAAYADTGVSAAPIALLAAEDISGRTIDTLHAVGDCYVSLTHGEGWSLGAYDAATLGKPVLITGWGGHLDYLGADYPGLITYRMGPVSGWLHGASYQPTQQWAVADVEHAGRLMRRMVSRYADQIPAATAVRERIVNDFAEPVIARRMIAAIDA
ncbi:MAG: glycosyltransferase [Casimicrobiaceae bacterium]